MAFNLRAAIFGSLVGAASAHYFANTPCTDYLTETPTAITTYRPVPTTIILGNHTYAVTDPTTLTITDCPCTVTTPKPTYTTEVVTAITTYCPAPTTITQGSHTY